MIVKIMNYIGDSGASSLAMALKVNSSLKVLDLSRVVTFHFVLFLLMCFLYNNIHDVVFPTFASALEVNSTLTDLVLSSCSLIHSL